MFLAVDLPQGTFCCGPSIGYDTEAGQCRTSTRNSFVPFNLTLGKAMYNRTSGSTGPNSTSTSTVTIVSTATALGPASPASRQNHDTAIGAGVGVPLGVLLVAATSFALYERRQRKRLQRLISASTGTHGPAQIHTSAKPAYKGTELGEGGQLIELEGHEPRELDARNRVQIL